MTRHMSFQPGAAFASVILIALVAVAAIGCNKQTAASSDEDRGHGHSHGDDHDHDHGHDDDQFHEHDHVIADHRPKDFAEAVESIRKLNIQIAEELGEGHEDHADEAVHQLLDVARWLPEIAADSDMPEDQWNTVDKDSQRLTELLDAMHSKLHNGGDVAYGKTDTAVKEIAGRLQELVDDGAWNTEFRREVASDETLETDGEDTEGADVVQVGSGE